MTEVMAKWDRPNTIPDELNRAMFEGGVLSYAGAGKDSRSCHFFVALEPNGLRLGKARSVDRSIVLCRSSFLCFSNGFPLIFFC